MTTCLLLDTETTRIKDPEVIELAWAELGAPGEGLVTIRGLTQRFQPRGTIDWGAMAVHNILPSELIGYPDSAIAPKRVPPADFWLGHNIDFDWAALGSPPGPRRIDTLAMARAEWPELDNHKLATLTYFLQGATEGTRTALREAHNAAADLRLCLDVFSFFQKKHKFTSWEEVWAFSEAARVPKIWGFGKFKGLPINSADRGYAKWYRNLPDADPYILKALKGAGL